jgi:hypothetical protein
MKSPMLLWEAVVIEYGWLLGVDTTMDLKKAHARFEAEGLSFLTITLPVFRKSFDKSLDLGKFDATLSKFFHFRGCLPAFLGGFTSSVFEMETGRLLDAPSVDAIQAIRQITGLYGSLFEVSSPERVKRALRKYVETDVSVANHEIPKDLMVKFRHALNTLFGVILGRLDLAVYQGTVVPRHSGGATAERLKGNAKWTFPEWTERLEEVFPYLDHTCPNQRLAIERLLPDGCGLKVKMRSVDEELPVRVIPVPKTQEKPRIIAIEPSYMQYMQQGLARFLMTELDRSYLSNVIRLRYREHNQELAKQGSIDRLTATLDLKDASDRLSWVLVKEGFASYPWLVRAMDATRSRTAQVDGLGVINLAKFASMGSGLTFPLQTIVFATIAIMGVAEARNTSVGSALRRNYKWLRVFGDDMIVPTDTLPAVIRNLEAFGFVINQAKTNGSGNFRESCGGEYYRGDDVSYVKVRAPWPETKKDAHAVVSAVSLRNRFFRAGLWRTAAFLDTQLAGLLTWYPDVPEDSPILGRETFLSPQGDGWSMALQTDTYKGYYAVDRIPRNAIDGVDALMRWFVEAGPSEEAGYSGRAFKSKADYERSGRPERVALKLGTWPKSERK